jgi:hypothetical protein
MSPSGRLCPEADTLGVMKSCFSQKGNSRCSTPVGMTNPFRSVASARAQVPCRARKFRTKTVCEEGKWSGRRDLNPRLRPWQGRTLPLSYSRSGGSVIISNGLGSGNVTGRAAVSWNSSVEAWASALLGSEARWTGAPARWPEGQLYRFGMGEQERIPG